MDISEQTIFRLYRKYIEGTLDQKVLFECQKELSDEIITAKVLNCPVGRKEALLEEVLWLKSYMTK